MKNILDKGAIKLNPNYIKDTFSHVIDIRQRQHLKGNFKKPLRVIPRSIKVMKIRKRKEEI